MKLLKSFFMHLCLIGLVVFSTSTETVFAQVDLDESDFIYVSDGMRYRIARYTPQWTEGTDVELPSAPRGQFTVEDESQSALDFTFDRDADGIFTVYDSAGPAQRWDLREYDALGFHDCANVIHVEELRPEAAHWSDTYELVNGDWIGQKTHHTHQPYILDALVIVYGTFEGNLAHMPQEEYTSGMSHEYDRRPFVLRKTDSRVKFGWEVDSTKPDYMIQSVDNPSEWVGFAYNDKYGDGNFAMFDNTGRLYSYRFFQSGADSIYNLSIDNLEAPSGVYYSNENGIYVSSKDKVSAIFQYITDGMKIFCDEIVK